MNTICSMGFRVLVLTVLLYLIFAVGSLVAGLGSTDVNNAVQAALSLLGVCFAFAVVTSYPVVRSKWNGCVLMLAMFWVVYGIMTFLTQIETVVFLDHLVGIMPPEMIPRLFVQGFVVAALFAPVLVLVHGKHRKVKVKFEQADHLYPATVKQWLWRLVVISVGYILIYLGFGLAVFAPLAGAAFGQYYSGLQMPVWILPFQALRALVWVSIAVPVIKMMKGKWWEPALAVALLYSVLMGFLLLLPNEFMPPEIRFAHFVEVSLSNFVFGWFVVWILTRAGRRRNNGLS